MSYGELNNNWKPTSYIIFAGQLVEIRSSIFEKPVQYGIIIGCDTPSFGITDDDVWKVLTLGQIKKISAYMLWPV